jgi:LTXXQ motif family protein
VRPIGLGVLTSLVLLSPALLTPAPAQQFKHRGGATPAAPRISVPAATPRISAPAISAPRFSAPARHIAAPTPRLAAPATLFSPPHVAPAPHVARAPHMAAPRFSRPRAPQIAAPHLPVRQIASPRAAAPRLANERGAPPGPAGLATRHAPNLAPRLSNAPAGRAARQALTPSIAPQQDARGGARTAIPRSLLGNVGTATLSTATPSTVGQGPTVRDRSLAGAAQALVRGPNGRLAVRNPVLANLAPHDPAARALAHSTFTGNFARTRSAWIHDWRWRRNRKIVLVLGFVGPVFWPYAYNDFINYTFWGYGYDTFWPTAFDDFYEGIYGAYAPEFYAGTGSGYTNGNGQASGYESRSRRGSSRTAALNRDAVPAGGAQICRRETQGLTDFPIQRIAEQVQPDQNQQALLDELKIATQQALEILRSACPTDLPTTPTGRMAAMRARVETMLRAVQVVRPVLEKFYASLSDEQKERFNALDAANLQTALAKRQQPEIAHVCSGRAARAVDVPVARIEHTLHLSGAQEDALRELKDASAKAADILAQNCPADQPLTPTGRLAAMEKRLRALLQAIDTVQPVLAKFYNSLSDEQKAQLNRLDAHLARSRASLVAPESLR